ncbi:MAG: META domain-containing protein [Dongiaceae bacterium]
MAFARIAATLAALLLVSAAAAADSAAFRARGNEPGWSLTRTDAGITFQTLDGKTMTISPLPAVQKGEGSETYRSTSGAEPFSVTIASQICVDSMSGMPYPARVTVQAGSTTYAGCGGEPASLLRGDWAVEAIAGKPVDATTHPSLSFGVDGQLSGDASCNRFFGTYALTGEGLSTAPGGSSMMMCPEPAMEQEQQLLALLGKIASFAIEPDGALILRAPDGRSVKARRKSP